MTATVTKLFSGNVFEKRNACVEAFGQLAPWHGDRAPDDRGAQPDREHKCRGHWQPECRHPRQIGRFGADSFWRNAGASRRRQFSRYALGGYPVRQTNRQ